MGKPGKARNQSSREPSRVHSNPLTPASGAPTPVLAAGNFPAGETGGCGGGPRGGAPRLSPTRSWSRRPTGSTVSKQQSGRALEPPTAPASQHANTLLAPRAHTFALNYFCKKREVCDMLIAAYN